LGYSPEASASLVVSQLLNHTPRQLTEPVLVEAFVHGHAFLLLAD